MVGLVIYVTFGLAVAAAWAQLHRTRIQLRHIAAWPVVHGSLFWAAPLPRWLRVRRPS